MSTSAYVLESQNEYHRLEFQKEILGYRFSEERPFIRLSSGAKVLDAGCGSGLLLRCLSEEKKNYQLHGVDCSEIRIQRTKKEGWPSELSVSLQVGMVESLPYEDNFFDTIVSRFVFQHLKNPTVACQELLRVLRPGGSLYLIDTDGCFINLDTSDEYLRSRLRLIADQSSVDLRMGRKLHRLLRENGLRNLDSEVLSFIYHGEMRAREIDNNLERMTLARSEILRILKREEEFNEFSRIYSQELKNPNNTLFLNKFIAWGTKGE